MVLKPNLRVDYKQSSSHGLGGTTQLTQFFFKQSQQPYFNKKKFSKKSTSFLSSFYPGLT